MPVRSAPSVEMSGRSSAGNLLILRIVSLGGIDVEVGVDPAFSRLCEELSRLGHSPGVEPRSKPAGQLSVTPSTDPGESRQGTSTYRCLSELDSTASSLAIHWRLNLDWPGTIKDLLIPLFIRLLAPRDSLVVHAAGVCLANTALLITGPSGAGKSTAARLLGGHILSDDIVLISDIHSKPLASSTQLGRISDGDQQCALGAILFPRKAPQFGLRRMDPPEALTRFFREHDFYLNQQSFVVLQHHLNQNIVHLFCSVPSYELSFSRGEIPTDPILAAISGGA